MKLPGGFSPTQALRTVADKANPFDGTDTDYDVFSDYSVRGGDRSPANGAFIGPQVKGVSTTAPSGGSAPTGGGGDGGAAARQAAAQAAAQRQARINTFGATQEGYTGGARQSLTDVGNTYDQRTRQFLTDLETGQEDINSGLAGNQLNLRRSMQNIIRGIQSGIRSGGVALAGMNAMDSGASDALARAYARVGNQQTGEARGQASTVNEDLQRKQGQLNTKKGEGTRDLDTYRDTETGRVRSDFGNKMDLLGAQAEGEGFGGVVNRGLVDQVLGEALARLQQIDAQRNQRLGGIRQWTPEQIMAEALRLDEMGQPGEAFSVTGPEVNYGGGGAVPISGAPLGQLPIFVKGRDDLATVPVTGRKDQLA